MILQLFCQLKVCTSPKHAKLCNPLPGGPDELFYPNIFGNEDPDSERIISKWEYLSKYQNDNRVQLVLGKLLVNPSEGITFKTEW